MFPRRKAVSLLTAFCFCLTFWYYHTTYHISTPPQWIPSPERPFTDKPTDKPIEQGSPLQPARATPIPPAPSNLHDHSAIEPATPILSAISSLHDQLATKPSGNHPVSSWIPLPTGKPAKIPKLQHDFGPESEADKKERLNRQAVVKASFVHSWEGYKKHAWLKDEVTPVKAGFVESFGGWAATLVDALDTLWMMGMKDEFEEALESLDKIDFSKTESAAINVFETTIRYMGGFLGAYDISGGKYPKLLEKALEVGNLVYGCFDTPNRMPITRWRWKNYLGGAKQQAGEATLIAELGSLSLELTRLSQLTGDPKFFDAIQRITDVLQVAQPNTSLPGLWPTTADARALTFEDTSYTLGGMADSVYEYLPKQHLLLGGLTSQYRDMYEAALAPIKEHIFFRPLTPDNANILISGSAHSKSFDDGKPNISPQPKGQHLSCFTGGMVALAAKAFAHPSDMDIARQLVDGCIWAYNHTQTGIMPEIFLMQRCKTPSPSFNSSSSAHCAWDPKAYDTAVLTEQPPDAYSPKIEDPTQRAEYLLAERRIPPGSGFTAIPDPRYLLRPEAIESIFVLYRLTGDKALQDAAWQMFQSIEKHTKTAIASAAIEDVTAEEPKMENKMESFWLAETLKYFYAVFSEPEVLDLDEFVLNTEAHTLRRPV